MINHNIVYTSIFISGVLLCLTWLFPNIDILVSSFTFNKIDGFIYSNNIVVKFLYFLIPVITTVLLILLVLDIFYIFFKYTNFKKVLLSSSMFILISIALGPGLLVNHLFKENFGRSRPKYIKYFNGTQNFSKVFLVSNECKHNCSFSSGHAAMGYSITSIAYVAPYIYFLRLYNFGLLLGTSVGISRIIMGGHFLSDILTSCFVILIINHLLYLCWKKIKSI